MVAERPPHAEVPEAREVAHGEGGETRPRKGDERREGARREPPQHERIEDVAYVFEEERPAGTVERKHLAVAAHLGARAGRHREEQHGQQHGRQHRRKGDRRAVPPHAPLQAEGDGPQHGRQHDHRMQPNEAPSEKRPERHAPPPTVVVGIADDEAREQEEEVDGQIAVVEPLVEGTRGESLEDMVPDDEQGGDAAQSVEDVVMGFGVGECRGRMFGCRSGHRFDRMLRSVASVGIRFTS